jgi:hypothetical protein
MQVAADVQNLSGTPANQRQFEPSITEDFKHFFIPPSGMLTE